VCRVPPIWTSKALSYELPQTSQFFIGEGDASDTPGCQARLLLDLRS
jgi:hypothetical protein